MPNEQPEIVENNTQIKVFLTLWCSEGNLQFGEVLIEPSGLKPAILQFVSSPPLLLLFNPYEFFLRFPT